MLKQLLDSGERRDIVVLYGTGSVAEVAYGDILEEAAERLATRIHIAVLDSAGAASDMTVGLIDEQVVRTQVPDFAQRLFFLSGPMPMVTSLRHTLRGLGVPPWHIRTDFFPGLA
jgi:ferredoxin-NADP reductase